MTEIKGNLRYPRNTVAELLLFTLDEHGGFHSTCPFALTDRPLQSTRPSKAMFLCLF
jgi:hypothetical protein